MTHPIRPATPADIAPLARLWHAGWHEAHAAHVPAELTRLRTRDTFGPRLEMLGDGLRTAGPVGAPLGFCAIRGAELYQLFVAPEARGTGLAEALLNDGEARLAASGIGEACLLCVPENRRAMRFYERRGWRNDGISRQDVDTDKGPFAFDLAVLRKEVAP